MQFTLASHPKITDGFLIYLKTDKATSNQIFHSSKMFLNEILIYSVGTVHSKSLLKDFTFKKSNKNSLKTT